MAKPFAYVSKKDEQDAGRTRDYIGVITEVRFLCVSWERHQYLHGSPGSPLCDVMDLQVCCPWWVTGLPLASPWASVDHLMSWGLPGVLVAIAWWSRMQPKKSTTN